jgi:hypothetical protein
MYFAALLAGGCQRRKSKNQIVGPDLLTGLSGHARSSDHGAQTWQIAGDILSGSLFSSMIAAVLQKYA